MTYHKGRVAWKVWFSGPAQKQYRKLPEDIKAILDALVVEVQVCGPVRGNWRNYSKLGSDAHHCHLREGRPVYVACWRVIDNSSRMVEVYYVGSREKAPY